jgi:peroxiredoxin
MKSILITAFLLTYSFIYAQYPTLEIGAQAPDFKLKGIDGKMYNLQSFNKSDILVILFTCNHCPTAQAYEDRVINMVNEYKSKNVRFVGISPNSPTAVRLDELGWTDLSDSYEEMKIRAKDKGYNFTYLYDGDKQEVAMKYGPVATPHVFIFDKTRKLRYTGRIDDVENPAKTPTQFDTKNAIEALLAGKEVSPNKTKVFGCSTKWNSKSDWKPKAIADWAKEAVSIEKIDVAGIKELIKNNSEKTRVINVWATWCGPCVAEFPDLMDVNHMYRHRDFEMITISADQMKNESKALAFLKSKSASTKNYIFNSDDKYALIEAVDQKWDGAIPITLVIEPGGKIVFKHMGEVDPFKLKKAIVDTKPIGRYF